MRRQLLFLFSAALCFLAVPLQAFADCDVATCNAGGCVSLINVPPYTIGGPCHPGICPWLSIFPTLCNIAGPSLPVPPPPPEPSCDPASAGYSGACNRCYVSYTNTCLTGFSRKDALGNFGYCQSPGMYAVATTYREAGAGCSGPVFPGSSYYWGNGSVEGTAYLCCKD